MWWRGVCCQEGLAALCANKRLTNRRRSETGEIVFFSAAIDDPHAFRLTSPWTWPLDIRWGRIFGLVRQNYL
jgi:hypothetical protein